MDRCCSPVAVGCTRPNPPTYFLDVFGGWFSVPARRSDVGLLTHGVSDFRAHQSARFVNRKRHSSDMTLRAQVIARCCGGREPGTWVVDRVRRQVVSASPAPLRHPASSAPSTLRRTGSARLHDATRSGASRDRSKSMGRAARLSELSAGLRTAAGNGTGGSPRMRRIRTLASTGCSILRWPRGGSGSWPFSSTAWSSVPRSSSSSASSGAATRHSNTSTTNSTP